MANIDIYRMHDSHCLVLNGVSYDFIISHPLGERFCKCKGKRRRRVFVDRDFPHFKGQTKKRVKLFSLFVLYYRLYFTLFIVVIIYSYIFLIFTL